MKYCLKRFVPLWVLFLAVAAMPALSWAQEDQNATVPHQEENTEEGSPAAPDAGSVTLPPSGGGDPLADGNSTVADLNETYADLNGTYAEPETIKEAASALAQVEVTAPGKWFPVEVEATRNTQVELTRLEGFRKEKHRRLKIQVKNTAKGHHVFTVIRPDGRSRAMKRGQVFTMTVKLHGDYVPPFWIDNSHSDQKGSAQVAVYYLR